MPVYHQVRALTRGLDVLGALGRSGGNVKAIAQALNLSRTTVYRLLETLESAGYASRSPSTDEFRPTIKVRELSDGFTDAAWVTEVATPVLGKLFQEVQWPSDLATPEGSAMLIRESTHRFSPLSIHRAMVGRRLPMLTALGRAYLAFSDEGERERVLELASQSNLPIDAWTRDRSYAAALLEKVRSNGFATSIGETDPSASAIALPIVYDGRVLASMNVIVFRRALRAQDMIDRYLPPLRRATESITVALATGKFTS